MHQIKFYLVLICVLTCGVTEVDGQNKLKSTCICGNISIDESWERVAYLSYIPRFEDMYAMSSEMIISETIIDSLGFFNFDTGYLPEKDHLYRLHIAKKGDTPNSIIIGGNDENHMFLVANRNSAIHITNSLFQPPFRTVAFENSGVNKQFQHITNIVHRADSISSISGQAKRQFVIGKMEEQLLNIADTSSHSLTSLYAIYMGQLEENEDVGKDFIAGYMDKWKDEESSYFEAFQQLYPPLPKTNPNTAIYIALIGVGILIGFAIGRVKIGQKGRGIDKLSVQERKIFELLQTGATNQEISEQHNIGVSTVKSHVSSIFAKMKVKSRKEVMNMGK